MRILLYTLILVTLSGSIAQAQDSATQEQATFRLLGLFMEVRVGAFQQAMAKFDNLEVVSVNYKTGETTLRLSGPLVLQKGDHEKQLRALNERVRIGTRGAFEVLPPQEKPLIKRTRIEVPIKGHNCLGCSFGAYRAVYKLNGVHRVTSDFGEGILIAWIDPKVTNRETLEAELAKKNVLLSGKEPD